VFSPHRRRIAGAARASQCEGSELASTFLNLHQSHELRHCCQ
jgi:hypothetical protein